MRSYSSVLWSIEALKRVSHKAVRTNAALLFFEWKITVRQTWKERISWMQPKLNYISHNMQHQMRTLFTQLYFRHKSNFCSFPQLFMHICPHAFCFRTSLCKKVRLRTAKEAKIYKAEDVLLNQSKTINIYFMFLCRTKITYIFVPSLRTLSP